MTIAAKPRAGFAGLGAMGSRMARRLRAAGYPLSVYNRSAAAAEAFRADGIDVAISPDELAARSDVVVSMLFDDEAVLDVLTGTRGVFASARDGLTVIEMSTVAPATSRRLHAEAGRRGIAYLDAPVSGSTPQAEQGELVILVGGDEATFARCRPLLLAMGKSAEHLGGPGAGSAAKLAVNAMLAVGVQALGEALALGERGGLDRKRLLDLLGQTAAVSPGQRAKFPNADSDRFPPTFALRTAAKDLKLITTWAAELDLPLPATAATRVAADRAVAEHGTDDFSVLIRTARQAHLSSERV